MVRCTRCRFSFEPEVPGLLPPCRQCGGETVHLGDGTRAAADIDAREPTLEFAPISQTA
jgi:Zn finger protein HypA/HybF involved in hydrogenase expression